jgi:hypothetical protein
MFKKLCSVVTNYNAFFNLDSLDQRFPKCGRDALGRRGITPGEAIKTEKKQLSKLIFVY